MRYSLPPFVIVRFTIVLQKGTVPTLYCKIGMILLAVNSALKFYFNYFIWPQKIRFYIFNPREKKSEEELNVYNQ
jgi:hypothetical protein